MAKAITHWALEEVLHGIVSVEKVIDGLLTRASARALKFDLCVSEIVAVDCWFVDSGCAILWSL